MSQYIFLSHFINELTPCYGGEKNISIFSDKSISKGDSANTHSLSFSNHIGTHIDFPYHFSEAGKKINDYTPDFWIFKKPFVIDYPANECEILTLGGYLDQIPTGCDFLIINTGFQRYRGDEKYWKYNPGIHPDLAQKLKEKGIKVIGFDFISISSYQNRALGRQAHHSFLIENDILIVEDMDLSKLGNPPASTFVKERKEDNNILSPFEKGGKGDSLIKIICFPLMLDNIDGAPVTAIGEIDG